MSKSQPLITHLVELRGRLLWSLAAWLVASLICYGFAAQIYDFLVRPLAAAMNSAGPRRLIYTNLTEAFFTYIKVALCGGLFVTFPYILWQVWGFVAPGLLKNERKAFLPFLIATPLLFFIGAAFVYFLVMPAAWHFFLSFETTGMETALPIQLDAKVNEYLDLVLTLIFAFGLCFELPVLLALLARAGLITVETLRKGRRYAIVLIFAVAAVLTPPDILSQILLAVPLMALYEISILLIAYGPKPQPENPL
ncbi:MAG: twin-arginine translocase subunit TatC [Alphaproteobacteria bacterium]|nr:twin-arginine translocase subunit TatC [Alphaproteobacteria bacterium]